MMKNTLGQVDLYVEPLAGAELRKVCEEMLAIAEETGEALKIEFNDTIIEVEPGDEIRIIIEQYYDKRK